MYDLGSFEGFREQEGRRSFSEIVKNETSEKLPFFKECHCNGSVQQSSVFEKG